MPISNFFVLVRFEMKKILSRKMVWVMLVIAIILNGYFMVDGFTGYYGELTMTEYQTRNREAIRLVEGKKWNRENYDDICNIIESNDFSVCDGINPVEWYISARISHDKNELTYDDYKDYRRSWVEGNYEEMQLNDAERAYWDRTGAETDTMILGFMGGWSNILSRLHLITVIYTLTTALTLCAFFSDEHIMHTDELTLCSRHGKDRLFLARFVAGEIIVLALGVLWCIEIFGLTAFLYGFDGYDMAVQLKTVESMYSLSIGKAVLICLGLFLLSSLMTAAFVMALSEITRNMLVPSALVFLSILFTVVIQMKGMPRAFNQVISYVPHMRVGMDSLLDERLVFGMNAFEFSYIIYPILILVFGVACWQSYIRYQVGK